MPNSSVSWLSGAILLAGFALAAARPASFSRFRDLRTALLLNENRKLTRFVYRRSATMFEHIRGIYFAAIGSPPFMLAAAK